MHEPCVRTANTHVNEDNADTSVWATILNSKGVEDGNDGTHPKMEQMETPTVTESKKKVDNIVPSNSEKEDMIAAQVACTTEKMVSKKI